MKGTISKKEMAAKLTQYTEVDLMGETADFQPGQYFFITLKPSDTEHRDELTHHFSIVNAPEQPGILAFTTRLRLEESLFKRTLYESSVGDEVETGSIEGDFVMPESTDKPVVFIALGIGITPYVSMLRHVLRQQTGYNLTLIYSDNETDSMPFLDELKQMDAENDNFQLILTVTHQPDWEGEKRHVDGQFLQDHMNDIGNRVYYISGPPKGVEAVTENLKQAGIPGDNIKSDSFDGY